MLSKRQANQRFHHESQGQTLIEILLATTVVAMVLTAIVAGLSLSVRNTGHARLQNSAVKYANETLEVFRRERQILGWESFRTALASDTYCINDLPTTSSGFVALSAGECAPETYISDTIFQREAMVAAGSDEVQVESVVTWAEGGKEKQVMVEQRFRNIDATPSPTPTP